MNTIWIALLTGLTAGGVSCLAVQGGLLASSLATVPDDKKNMGTLLFLGAKIVSYTLLGFLLGFFGASLSISSTVQGWLQIMAGLYMIATAANLLQIHPIFRYVVVQPPTWAKIVSLQGGLGTVSGTAADRVMAAKLAIGDPDGHFRRALSYFPFQQSAQRVLNEFYIEEGDTKKTRRAVPVYSINPSRLSIELIVCANFAFVWLAKEGHNHPVSVNYLEKIAMPHVYAVTGAVLAGVDVITMGAGLLRNCS
jgi:hypothetical protein